MTVPFSAFPETVWPAVPSPYAAGLFALLFQLEQTQWWTPAEIEAQQRRQLALLLEHAAETVPFYAPRSEALKAAVNSDFTSREWLQVPLLSRRDVQTAGDRLYSTRVPSTHGAVGTSVTSGSTGQPVVVRSTGMVEYIWRALTLRDHFWHRRDFRKTLAIIRHTANDDGRPPLGKQADNWGVATEKTIPTAESFLLSVQSTIDEQASWLKHINPGYVLSYPSTLKGIADVFEAKGWTLPNLQEIRTFGEILEPNCRATCQRVFGTRVVDMYSSQEVGYIALECPAGDHYHIQCESLVVEILDDHGRPCAPGQVGRVVITSLHNFAMPLVRYEIGDYAEVGEACACGRGLPVLKRILGRQRNLLRLPTGQRCWPVVTLEDRPEELPAFFQYQLVQRRLDEIELNVVRPVQGYTADEQVIVERFFQKALGYPFKIVINCVDEIPRSPSGKFEDFISLVV